MSDLIVPCPSCGTKNRIPTLRQHLAPKCGSCKKNIDPGPWAVAVELDDHSLEDFIRTANRPVMVDFFSPTCGPCRQLAPTIENLARSFYGRAIVAKLDTSRNPTSAQRYGIRGVPTLLFFKNGRLADQLTGAAPEPLLIQRLNSIL